jgi:hypothetical protein
MEEQTPDSPTSKKKTGNKPKQLVEATYTGIEVGRGENKKVIDPKEVEKLAGIGMKNSEISEYLEIDDSTLAYNFKQQLVKGRHNLKVSLRRAQLSLALSGNATLLIWLGKNILGQSESPFDSEGNAPLPWDDNV